MEANRVSASAGGNHGHHVVNSKPKYPVCPICGQTVPGTRPIPYAAATPKATKTSKTSSAVAKEYALEKLFHVKRNKLGAFV